MDSSIVPKTVGPTTRSKRAIATLETDATQKLPVSRLNMEEPPEQAVKTEAGSSSCVKAEPQQLKKVKKETATTSRVQEPQPQPRRAVKAEPQPSTAMVACTRCGSAVPDGRCFYHPEPPRRRMTGMTSGRSSGRSATFYYDCWPCCDKTIGRWAHDGTLKRTEGPALIVGCKSCAQHTYDEAPSPTGYSLDDEVESDNEDCCIM